MSENQELESPGWLFYNYKAFQLRLLEVNNYFIHKTHLIVLTLFCMSSMRLETQPSRLGVLQEAFPFSPSQNLTAIPIPH
jgi:hypothetical protein